MRLGNAQYALVLMFILSFILLFQCQKPATPEPNEHKIAPLPEQVEYPAGNPYNKAKEKLGRLLFFDPLLSANNKISCASCHQPHKGYTDGLDRSIGFDGVGQGANRSGSVRTTRNAPTILNTAFNGIDAYSSYEPSKAPMFYDNRVSSLENQCLGPLFNEKEMLGPEYTKKEYQRILVGKLQSIPQYRGLFHQSFGDSTPTLLRITQAIATFERSLITPNAPFDKYARGDDDAISDKAIRGLEAFMEAGCNKCHSGPMFSDYRLHRLGVEEHPELVKPDKGNGDFKFRTPTLRNLEFTSPYMHNGTHKTLEEVMEFYEEKDSRNPHVQREALASEFRELSMPPFDRSRTEEIIAFLETLNDPDFDRTIPDSVPSGLPVLNAK